MNIFQINQVERWDIHLLQAAVDLGAEITLVSGPTDLNVPDGPKREFISVDSSISNV